MKIRFNHQRAVTILVAMTLTLVLFVVGVGLVYAGRNIIRKGRSIQEQRDRQMTNDLTAALEKLPDEWLIAVPPPVRNTISAPGSSGEMILELSDEVASNIFATVAEYRIEHADSLAGQWIDTGNTIAGDLQSLRELMLGMSVLESRERSNSPSGFYRAVKLR